MANTGSLLICRRQALIGLGAAAFAGCALPVPPAQASPADPIAAARERLPRTMSALAGFSEGGLQAGAQLFVSLEGRAIADIGLGQASPGAAMTPDSLAVWFSNTKVVTALAIARLWEAGALDVDDFIADHVPAFAANGKDRVRIRHALTHTGGFPAAGRALWLGGLSPALIEAICAAPLEEGWVPGEAKAYHPASAAYILAAVIEQVSGQRFSDFVRAQVFLPLGMSDSWVGMPADEIAAYGARLALLYSGTPGNLRPGRAERPDIVNPGFGGRGPVRELAGLYEMALRRGQAEGKQFLRPQTLEAMTADHTAGVPLFSTRGQVESPPQGFGFARAQPYFGRYQSARAFGHAGGAESVAMADPEHGLALAFWLNGRLRDGQAAAGRLATVSSAVYEDLGLARG